jgi:hypothetical protein
MVDPGTSRVIDEVGCRSARRATAPARSEEHCRSCCHSAKQLCASRTRPHHMRYCSTAFS